LPSVHQRRLRDAEANRQITNTSTSAIFIPIQLQHPTAMVNSVCKADSKCLSANNNQGQSQETYPTNPIEVRSEAGRSAYGTSSDKYGTSSEDSASSSCDDLAEEDDNNDASFESSVLTPPQVVELRGSAAFNEDTLSSLVDLSLSFAFDEDEEGNAASRSSTSEQDVNKIQVEGNPMSLVAMDNEDAVMQVKSPNNKDSRSKVELNAAANQVNADVAEVSIPAPSTRLSQKAKGVSFENSNVQSKFRQKSKIPRWKKKARNVSSSCSTKAVKMLPSFMSPTRASMAKNRGPNKRNVSASKSTENTRKGRATSSALQPRGGTNDNTRRNQRVNVGVSARGKENENVSNTADAVSRVKRGSRQRPRKLQEIQTKKG